MEKTKTNPAPMQEAEAQREEEKISLTLFRRRLERLNEKFSLTHTHTLAQARQNTFL
jgi:hypothetical protein